VQIQINTGRHIEADARLRESVEAEVTGTLGRFGERLTRVEVHLTDVNADKGGRDTRCVMEARPAGLQPVKVDELAHSVDAAVRAAAGKLERALDSRLGRLGRR
jgi:ribosome-associated translation inhibitor RaiA